MDPPEWKHTSPADAVWTEWAPVVPPGGGGVITGSTVCDEVKVLLVCLARQKRRCKNSHSKHDVMKWDDLLLFQTIVFHKLILCSCIESEICKL